MPLRKVITGTAQHGVPYEKIGSGSSTINDNWKKHWIQLAGTLILQYELDYIKSGHENKGKNRLQDNSLENLKLVVVYWVTAMCTNYIDLS